MDSSWEVGDIIWVVIPKKMVIIPAQVTELIVRKSLKGTDVTHVIEIPTADGTTRSMQLQKTGGMGFTTLKDAEDFVTEKAISQIKEICARAAETKQEFFDDEPIPTELEAQDAEDFTFIEMPDGTRARVRLDDVNLGEQSGTNITE